MDPKFIKELKSRFQQKFPSCTFESTTNKLTVMDIELPIIPEEINKIIQEEAQPFNLRTTQIAWKLQNSSIIIFYAP